jgi:N-methylhydantoinase B
MRLDAVGLEVMAHAFASVAEEMGLVLVHSALSPNIRERRDASAALFDADGEMIAQAAHIPVHLGALADAVAAVRRLDPTPGELFLLNDPYAGGSHLPDLTLIGAIDVDGRVGGYSVVRAHHSDVGGMTAGSMPAGARELYQEGLVIPPSRLTRARTPAPRQRAHTDHAAWRSGGAARCGRAGRRRPARVGEAARLEARSGRAARELLDYAERRTKALLGKMAVSGSAIDYLEGDGVIDDDLEIRVAVQIADGLFHADFTGTRDAAPGNVNCPLAVTRSAVLFVVRTLLPDDVPMNGGVPRVIRVTAPPGVW